MKSACNILQDVISLEIKSQSLKGITKKLCSVKIGNIFNDKKKGRMRNVGD